MLSWTSLPTEILIALTATLSLHPLALAAAAAAKLAADRHFFVMWLSVRIAIQGLLTRHLRYTISARMWCKVSVSDNYHVPPSDNCLTYGILINAHLNCLQ